MNKRKIVFLIVIFSGICAIYAWIPSTSDFDNCKDAGRGLTETACRTAVDNCYNALREKCHTKNKEGSKAFHDCLNAVLNPWPAAKNKCPYE